MPDLDSGHIFLTTMAPIRDTQDGAPRHSSFTQAARIALAKLPTALQSPATQQIGVNSPFSRNRRTHLARMFVLNDTVYNGRAGKNALWASITRDSPAKAKPVDRLNTSYLVFCADIDAVEKDGDALPKGALTPSQQRKVRDAYAIELWDTMQDELRSVYSNCVGFEEVETAQDFANYLNRCHVTTTMPFHDYYLELPKFNRLPVGWLLAAVGIPAVLTVIALLLRIFGVETMPVLGIGTAETLVGALLLTGVAGFAAVKYALANGEKPLPPGKYDDLPSVLKSLYLQQRFSDFAVDAQGASDADLHRQFGAFLEAHKPSDRSGPTQTPGVIQTPHP